MSQRFRVYDGHFPHFITCAITHWIPVFGRDDYFSVLRNSLTYCITQKGLLIHCYVFMPNHFHLICSQVSGKLTDVIRDMKAYTSKEISRKLAEDDRTIWLNAMQRAGGSTSMVKVWQDGYHPEEIHSEDFCLQKMDYMHNNPLRAGYVEAPSVWKYSSAGFYYINAEPLIPVTPVEW